MHRTLLILLALSAPLLGGCAAGRASYFLLDAQRKLDAAAAEGAEKRAAYEYTMAREFLRKAKEENGYSDFGATESLSRRSIEYAAAAYERSSDDGRPDVTNAEQIVPEVREEKKPEEKDNFEIDLDDP